MRETKQPPTSKSGTSGYKAHCRGRQAATSDMAMVLGAGMVQLRGSVYIKQSKTKQNLMLRTRLTITDFLLTATKKSNHVSTLQGDILREKKEKETSGFRGNLRWKHLVIGIS